MNENQVLGIDVGGSGIKGAIVNIKTGKLITERHRIETPKPSKPKAVANTFSKIVKQFNWKGLIGVGFPSVIKNGVAMTAANIDKKWIGTNVEKLFSEAVGSTVFVQNDADVAGLAEVQHGIGKNQKGTVVFITIGTGLGSAIFVDGRLLPNSELGHLKFKGGIAEHYAADSVRKKEDLSWDAWGKRFNEYLHHLNLILAPNLVILGGGGSKKFERYKHKIDVDCKIVPAQLLNHAGIIGAASLAAIKTKKTLAE